MANNFHIVGRTSHIGDVQRTYNWQVSIPKPIAVSAPDWEEDLLLRARSAAIPGVTINQIESSFMGMKQQFAGNATLEHSLAVEFEEFEDQKILEYLNLWSRSIFDTQNVTNGGGAFTAAESKADYSVTLTLNMFKNNRESTPKKILFHNAWLQSYSSVSLGYGDASSVKYPATFYWDYYTIEDA